MVNTMLSTSTLNFQDLFMLALEEVFKAPLHNYCIFDVRGEIEIERFNEAVWRLLDIYPIMRMKPKAQFSLKHLAFVVREPIYDFDSNIVDFIDLDEGDFEQRYNTEVANFINAPIKVWEELPFKILLMKKGKNEYTILIKVHHYATDGIGAICFVNALLEEYNKMSLDGKAPRTSQRFSSYFRIPNSEFRIPKGGMLSVVPHRKLFRKHLFLRNIRDMLSRYINAAFFPSVRLAGGQLDAPPTPAPPKEGKSVNILHRVLKPEELNKLREKAKLAQVTLNDYFIAASILAIDEWNSKQGEKSDRISIEVPVNLRPIGSFYEWVGNWCSSVSISTRPKDRVDFNTLLVKINSQTKFIFENGLAYTLIYMAAWTKFLPFSVIKFLSKIQAGTGADTTVVSFLGNIMRFQQRKVTKGRTVVDSRGSLRRLSFKPQSMLNEVNRKPLASVSEANRKAKPKVSEVNITEIVNCIACGPVCFKMGCSICLYLLKENLNITLAYRDTLLTEEKAKEFLNLFVHWLQS